MALNTQMQAQQQTTAMPLFSSGRTRHLLVPRCYPATLSLVIPMYNEESAIPMLRVAVEVFLKELPTDGEVILVNDGSSDSTIQLILDWALEDSRIKILQLSRNFGHQMAATAGLDYATGDAVVLLDADLQDPLPVVHRMIEKYCEGYDVAYGQRQRRSGDTAFKRGTAWLFYRIMQVLVDQDIPADSGDFRLISRRCLAGLKQMRETHRFLRAMAAWVGFPQVAVPYSRRPRVAGATKYPLRKMVAFAWTAATSFSTVPLRLTFVMGLLVGALSVEEAVRSVLAHIFGWFTVSGWSSLMLVTTGIGSALLVSVGILGEYVGRLYEQVKQRPMYLVSDTYNIESRLAAGLEGEARLHPSR